MKKSAKRLKMTIKGFGTIFDFEKKTSRRYYVDENNVKRWVDDATPVDKSEAQNDD